MKARAAAAAFLIVGASPLLATVAGVTAAGAAGPAPAALQPAVTGAASQLGGYSLAATAASVRATYEQPDLPLPATPTVELDLGYSTATLGSGPVGEATASEVYPGQVVASSGGELGEIVPGAPALPDWPVQAHTSSPGGTEHARDDDGPVTMEATSAGATSTASASVGTAAGAAALPAGLVTVQHLASSALTSAAGTTASATATASAQGIALVGGLVEVKSVTSTVTGASHGAGTRYSGSTDVVGVTVAGEPVTVTGSGVKASSTDAPIGLSGLTPLQILQQAGISLQVTHAGRAAAVPAGSVGSAPEEASGLELRVDFTTYDNDFARLVTELPSQLASVLFELPVPLPDQQVTTLDLGWAEVSALASPAYVAPPVPPPGGGMPQGGAPQGTPSSPPASVPSLPATGTAPAVANAGGTAPPAHAAAARPPQRPRSTSPAVVPGTVGMPVVFRGIGGGLLGGAVLAVLAFGAVVMRADRRLFAGARRAACGGRGRP